LHIQGEIDPADGKLKALYSEKLEVGYRWYAAHNVTPKFRKLTTNNPTIWCMLPVICWAHFGGGGAKTM
jgi:hypothetical protein